MLIIKLGGSVITDKSKSLTPREEVIKRLAREIAGETEQLILVHGGGSFGHIRAREWGLDKGLKDDDQREGIFIVQRDMRALNNIVVDALHEAGVPVTPIPAGAITVFEDGMMAKFPSEIFAHYLDIGMTPMTFGDAVVDMVRGVAICSGDDIVRQLAIDLKVKRCIFVTAVDGIFARYPPSEGEGPLAEVRPGTDISFSSADPDVTGSMARKLEKMFDIVRSGCRVQLVNGLVPDRLTQAIAGQEMVGTKIIGD
jgi:isopentenyl phosphate kinase